MSVARITVLAGAAFCVASALGQATPPPADAALGRRVFIERCAKCHDENAAKPLPDGTSLVQRLAARPDLAAALASRTRKMTEAERRGLVLYMKNLVTNFRTQAVQ